MASLKSHFWACVLLITGRKRAIKDGPSIRATIPERRKTIHHAPPEGVLDVCDVREETLDGQPVYYATPKGVDEGANGYVYYLHGGAYVFEIIPQHWALVGELAVRTGRTFVVPIYPLAPEHDVNAALPFAEASYRALEARAGDKPIHMFGDSAGAAMCLSLCQTLIARGESVAARSLVLVSPWMDVALENPVAREIDPRDPWLAVDGLQEAGRMYANGMDMKDPRVSPLYGAVEGLPPVHIFMGTRDVLMPDVKAFADKLSAVGAAMSYRQYDGMFHCWIFLKSPEADAANSEIVDLLRA
ncbi:MAG: alpha/beta hydrolase [Alphaproteobacteria bacterium]|nr:alpha/beta hydrolase [Alphaproteobacteria bacterium]